VTEAEVLGHTSKSVIKRSISMGMETTHDVTNDFGTLYVWSIWTKSGVPHAIKNATVDRLKAISDIWKCARNDNGH
jgi:hypothetical protein